MKKFAVLMAAAAFAITPAFAGDKEKDKSACCAVKGDMDCAATYAKLNLTPEQKAKMDALVEKCKGAGCTKESTEAFMKSAESILTKEQLATFKTECRKAQEANLPKA